jgi:hypothetical protein
MSIDNEVLAREIDAIKTQLKEFAKELDSIKAQLKGSDESKRRETEHLYEEFGKKSGRAYKSGADDEPETQF